MSAIVISSAFPAYCARLEQFDRPALLRIGLDGSGLAPTSDEEDIGLTAGEIARQALELAMDGYVTLRGQGTTDTNTAASTAVNLNDQGVTFPDATNRRIETLCKIADVDGQGYVEGVACVDGGATPIVVTDSASADPLVSGLGGTPTAVLSVSGGEVILTCVGITDVDCRWDILVRVFPATGLAYIATT
jgi:hypothetical protein